MCGANPPIPPFWLSLRLRECDGVEDCLIERRPLKGLFNNEGKREGVR
jgi:hypothetical protein